jgi:hypothetical protein
VHLAGTHLPLDDDSERTRAAADVENFLTWRQLGQLYELFPDRLVPPERDDCAEKIVPAAPRWMTRPAVFGVSAVLWCIFEPPLASLQSPIYWFVLGSACDCGHQDNNAT